MEPLGFFLILAAPFVGSFLGLTAQRLPAGQPVLLGRSRCDRCAAKLGPLDLVPILSWLWLRGHCRHCGAAIDGLLPVVEFASLAVALWSLLLLPPDLALPGAVLGWSLLLLAVIDYRCLLLPDLVTLPLMLLGLAVAWWIEPTKIWAHGLGAAIGFVGLAAVAWIYRRFRGIEGLGLGDAKLFAASGAWVSWSGLASVLLLAALAGLAGAALLKLSGRPLGARDPLPFGPFLAAGTWLVWLYGPLQWP